MLLKGKHVAYLGVLLGLNILFVILSSVIESNTITLLAAAALIVGIAVVEFGWKNALIFYAASSILGFLLTFNKAEVIIYIVFFGPYSIMKHFAETHIEKKIKSLAAKLLFFNLSLAVMFIIMKLLIPIKLQWWMVLGAEGFFFIYDYAFTVFINYYMNKIKPKVDKIRR
jgi:hypothetical protein